MNPTVYYSLLQLLLLLLLVLLTADNGFAFHCATNTIIRANGDRERWLDEIDGQIIDVPAQPDCSGLLASVVWSMVWSHYPLNRRES